MKTFSIILFFFCFLLFAQSSNDLVYRTNYNLKLASNEDHYFETAISDSFYLRDNTLTLYPGEKVYIELEMVENHAISMKAVKSNINPAKTITVKFDQTKIGTKHIMNALSINNPFNKILSFSASTFMLKSQKWLDTEVTPVKANSNNINTWQDIVQTIRLTNWELIEKP